jgi:hypothetical protein
MKAIVCVLVAASSVTFPAAAQVRPATVQSTCNITGSRIGHLASPATSQYVNGLGFDDQAYMEGYHVIASDAAEVVDELSWGVGEGYYTGPREGMGDFSTCYEAANWGRAYPVGADPDEHLVVVGDTAQGGGFCVPENPDVACNQTCWTACHNGACPPQEWTQCTYCSPLVLDGLGDGILTTGAEDPVSFDVDADGTLDLMGWVARNRDDVFLWRDVEKNHRVDDGSELFGVGMKLPDGTRATHGFEALAAYDAVANGGNGDGQITPADLVWRRLLLWQDANHNGVSEPKELSPIQSSCVVSMNLHWFGSSETDPAGNQHRMVSTYRCRAGNKQDDRALVDVFFRVLR